MLSVVDENVVVVANDLSRISLGAAPTCPEASENCRVAAADELARLARDGGLVLDAESEFFDKYRACASMAGQPGIADVFVKLVFERGYDPAWCCRVKIRNAADYILPQAILDSGFDRDDLCWLAAAHNCGEEAEVLNAVDSDYAEWSDEIAAAGIAVREIC
jgi:hypothetical protein